VLITAAIFFLAATIHALWIPAKASLAQGLLAWSWDRIVGGDVTARPWPWADTRPAARLSVPARGIEQWVLEGNSSRNLAFGPVLLAGGITGDDRVINGHRDTHFRFLEWLEPGEIIWLETTSSRLAFRVSHIDIVDSRRQDLVLNPEVHRLSLVTCYPFDAPTAGGPLRYVVTALPVERSELVFSRPAASSG